MDKDKLLKKLEKVQKRWKYWVDKELGFSYKYNYAWRIYVDDRISQVSYERKTLIEELNIDYYDYVCDGKITWL